MSTSIPISHQQAQYFFDYPEDGPLLKDFRAYQRWDDKQQEEQYGISRNLPSQSRQQVGEMVEQLLNIYSPDEKVQYFQAIKKAIPNYRGLHPHLLQNNAGLAEATRDDEANKGLRTGFAAEVSNRSISSGEVNPDLIDPLTGLTKISYHPNDAEALNPGLAVIKEIDQTAAELGSEASLTEEQRARLMQASLSDMDWPTMEAGFKEVGYGEQTLQYFEKTIPGHFAAQAQWQVVKSVLALKQGWQDENELDVATREVLWSLLHHTSTQEGGVLDVVKFLTFAAQHSENMTPKTAIGLTEIWKQLNPANPQLGINMETFAKTLEERTGINVLSDDISSEERWSTLLASPAILASDKDWTPEELQKVHMQGRDAWNDTFGKWKSMDDLSIKQYVIEYLLSKHLSEMLREDIQPHELAGEIESALTQISSRKDLTIVDNIRWPWEDLSSEVNHNVLGNLAPELISFLKRREELTTKEAMYYLKSADRDEWGQRTYDQATQAGILANIKDQMPELLLAYPKLEDTYLSSREGIGVFMAGISRRTRPFNIGKVVDEEGNVSYDPYLHKRRVKQLQDIRAQVYKENKHLIPETEPAKMLDEEITLINQLDALKEETTTVSDPNQSLIHIMFGSDVHQRHLANGNPKAIQAENIAAARRSGIYTKHMEVLLGEEGQPRDIPGLLDFPIESRQPGETMQIDMTSLSHVQKIAVIKTVVDIQQNHKSDSGLINHPIVAQIQEYVRENIDALNVDFVDRITAQNPTETDMQTGEEIINTLALLEHLIKDARGRTSMNNLKGVLDIQGDYFTSTRLLINLNNAIGITNFVSVTTPEEIQAAFASLKVTGQRAISILVASRGQPETSVLPAKSKPAIYLRELYSAKDTGSLLRVMNTTITGTGNITQADVLRSHFGKVLRWSFPNSGDVEGWRDAYERTLSRGAIIDGGLYKEIYDSNDTFILEAGVYQNLAAKLLFERGSSDELPLGLIAKTVLAGPITTKSENPWNINEFRDLIYDIHNTSTGRKPMHEGVYYGTRITAPAGIHDVIDKLPQLEQESVDEAGGLLPYILNEENYWNASVRSLTIPTPPPRGEFATGVGFTTPRQWQGKLPELTYKQVGEIVLGHFDLTHEALKDLDVEAVVKTVIMSARKHAFIRERIVEERDDIPLDFDIAHKTMHYAMTGALPPLRGSLDPKMDLKIRDLVLETIYRLTPENAGELIDGRPVPLPLGFTRGEMGMPVLPAIEKRLEKRILEKYHSGWGHDPGQPLHIYGGADKPIRLDVTPLPTNGQPIRIELNGRYVPWLQFRIKSKKHQNDPEAILKDRDNFIGSDYLGEK